MDSLDRLRLIWILAIPIVAGLLAAAFFASWSLRRRRRRLGSFLTRLSLSAVSLVATLSVLELVFAFWIVPSDGYGETLAGRLWFARHWKPINSYGYRDYERKRFAGRRVLIVVGDSFVAGHGIENVEDRFPNRLARLLGRRWEFSVVADTGWGTGTELKQLEKFPVRPTAVVLSYFVNDIKDVARRHDFNFHEDYRPPGPVLGVAVNHSFFLNWAYWRLYRRTMGNEYWGYLRAAYSNPEIWADHASELEALADHVEKLRATLCVAVWPDLANVRQSREVTDKVVRFYRERGSSVVDLAEAFEDIPTSELRVNDLDAHPNPSTHRSAALLIHKQLVELGVTAGTRRGPASARLQPR